MGHFVPSSWRYQYAGVLVAAILVDRVATLRDLVGCHWQIGVSPHCRRRRFEGLNVGVRVGPIPTSIRFRCPIRPTEPRNPVRAAGQWTETTIHGYDLGKLPEPALNSGPVQASRTPSNSTGCQRTCYQQALSVRHQFRRNAFIFNVGSAHGNRTRLSGIVVFCGHKCVVLLAFVDFVQVATRTTCTPSWRISK